jgi:hypothetical protein
MASTQRWKMRPWHSRHPHMSAVQAVMCRFHCPMWGRCTRPSQPGGCLRTTSGIRAHALVFAQHTCTRHDATAGNTMTGCVPCAAKHMAGEAVCNRERGFMHAMQEGEDCRIHGCALARGGGQGKGSKVWPAQQHGSCRGERWSLKGYDTNASPACTSSLYITHTHTRARTRNRPQHARSPTDVPGPCSDGSLSSHNQVCGGRACRHAVRSVPLIATSASRSTSIHSETQAAVTDGLHTTPQQSRSPAAGCSSHTHAHHPLPPPKTTLQCHASAAKQPGTRPALVTS